MLTAKLILYYVLVHQFHVDDTVDIEQAYCMALNIYHESRGESVADQFGVAHTILNRVEDRRYPSTICDVVKDALGPLNQPLINKCQFSWFCDGRPDTVYVQSNTSGEYLHINIDSFERASVITALVMTGVSKDNTGGATHYYNPKKVDPRWAKYYIHTVTYSGHKFLKRPANSPR